MTKINFREKEIAEIYSIPLKTLKKCRKSQQFGKDVCFTAPESGVGGPMVGKRITQKLELKISIEHLLQI